ncbi:hypothetical protein GM661_16485 [Iocasia frigidifontis]|uniref:Uncharacterized protein n=1 Tax=Iocasia fonsfrigidae TaxID=2682810 RepID=A0A8A7KKR0_9FIRM|nr:hypothetical protein [Iocasia fonsfrigidae]QTL99427.1 hypothetical protein GM661_16485 [Iocasia fonsfrigidae]
MYFVVTKDGDRQRCHFKISLTGRDRDVKIYLVVAKSGKLLELLSSCMIKRLFQKNYLTVIDRDDKM